MSEPITDEALWDFADDLKTAWNIEDVDPPSLIESFRDLFVARFGYGAHLGEATEVDTCAECENPIESDVYVIPIFRRAETFRISGYAHAWHFRAGGVR